MADTDTILKRPWLKWLMLFGACAIPTLVTASLFHLRMLHVGQPSNYWLWLADQAAQWYAWGALTPLIVWLGRKVRIERETWHTSIPLHLVFGAVIATAQGFFKVWSSITLFGEPGGWPYIYSQFIGYLAWSGTWTMMVYWGILGGSYAFEYFSRYRQQELVASQLESTLTRTHLETLQRQLQPHFLFNTINSISVLIQKGETGAANKMLTRLSELLRWVLSRESVQELPLSEELAFVEAYLEIEQTRFGDRLRIDLQIAPDTLTAHVPSFMLQLLVENGIRHGIARKAGSGIVTVTARRSAEWLHLEVTDQAEGSGDRPLPADSPGIGLANARGRLALLYGDRFDLDLRPIPSGTVASLRIPYRE